MVIDRDLNATINTETRGVGVPMVHRELTAAKTLAAILMIEYYNNILYVKASMVVETGSSLL